MIKLMIPFSGGLNSTTLVIRALKQGLNFVAPYYDPGWETKDHEGGQFGKCEEVAALIEADYGPFERPYRLMTFRDDAGNMIDTREPAQAGFTHKHNTSYIVARYYENGRAARDLRADEVWLGYDNQNTHVDTPQRMWHVLKDLSPNTEWKTPFLGWNNPADEHVTHPDFFTPKRFQQYADLPPHYQAAIRASSHHGTFDIYHEMVEGEGISVGEMDEWAEYIGGFGDFIDLQNPESYRWGQHLENIKKSSNWDGFLGKRSGHPVRPGIKRAREAVARVRLAHKER